MSAIAPEDEGIRQAINFYIDGLREGSVETLKEAFHSDATMCGYFGETLMVTPIQGLYDFVNSNPAPAKTGEPFSASIAAFEIAGSIASAKIIEQSYQGHNFTTLFNLLKIDGRWWIVSKVFNIDS